MKKGKITVPEQKKSGDRIGYTHFVYRIHVIGTSNLSIKFDRLMKNRF